MCSVPPRHIIDVRYVPIDASDKSDTGTITIAYDDGCTISINNKRYTDYVQTLRSVSKILCSPSPGNKAIDNSDELTNLINKGFGQ